MPPGALSSSFMDPGSSVKVTALALIGLSFEFGVDTKREDDRVGVCERLGFFVCCCVVVGFVDFPLDLRLGQLEEI